MQIKKCLECRKTFYPHRSNHKYCCNACRQMAFRRRQPKAL